MTRYIIKNYTSWRDDVNRWRLHSRRMTVEWNCIHSTVISLWPLKDSLVRLSEKLEVCFPNSQMGPWLPGLNKTLAHALVWGQGQGSGGWQLGSSLLLWCGNGESHRPGCKSCVLLWHCNFSFLWVPVTTALVFLLQQCDVSPWIKVLPFTSCLSCQTARAWRARMVPCSLPWLPLLFSPGPSTWSILTA